MLIVVLILLTLFLIVFVKERKYSKIRRQISHMQGPKMLPFVGNAHQMGKTPKDVLNFLFDNFYKYGNFRFWVGYYLNILVTDVKDVEFILASNTLVEKSDIYELMHPWLGEGLLTSKGAKQRSHRKMITPSFHFKILQEFHEVMNMYSTKFMDKLREVSNGETIFDFQHLVCRLTVDIICDSAMGVPINAMDNPHSEFASALEYMCCAIYMRAFNPLKRKMATYQFFPDYKDYCKALNTLKDFTYDVIEKRMELRKQQEANKANDDRADSEFGKPKLAFLDNLLSSTIDGKPLTRQELYEEVSTFIFAGHDTTSSAISFAIYLLSRHPTIQQKVLEEQQRVMQGNLKRDATFQELTEMKYLDLVLKETLRIYPSVPLIGRYAEQELNINGKIIPAGTSLLLFIMGMGYNEETFPDPYRFKPERFEMRTNTDNPFEYVPFSAGPRNCPGQKYGILEFKTVVSKIVRNFEILPALDELESKDGYVSIFYGPHQDKRPKPHKYDPIPFTALTLSSENGILVRMKERK